MTGFGTTADTRKIRKPIRIRLPTCRPRRCAEPTETTTWPAVNRRSATGEEGTAAAYRRGGAADTSTGLAMPGGAWWPVGSQTVPFATTTTEAAENRAPALLTLAGTRLGLHTRPVDAVGDVAAGNAAATARVVTGKAAVRVGRPTARAAPVQPAAGRANTSRPATTGRDPTIHATFGFSR